jgi:hypothetical protein
MRSSREKRQSQRRRALIQQRAERIRALIDGGFIRDEKEIPDDAIPASIPLQKDGRHTYRKRLFYLDREFECKECGKKERWRAEDQQWYFEIAKGPIHGEAVLCHDCRLKMKEANQSLQPTPIPPGELGKSSST